MVRRERAGVMKIVFIFHLLLDASLSPASSAREGGVIVFAPTGIGILNKRKRTEAMGGWVREEGPAWVI